MECCGYQFDRFDICEAYWCFAANWHSGQGSEEYSFLGRLSNLGFRPAVNLNFKNLTENGRMIYNGLKKRFGRTLITKNKK